MPDLNDSIKSPFVRVFDKAANEIANNFGDGDITVTSFKYKFDDEDDDICTIKMQMATPKALDLLNIGRGTELRIIWGYINGVRSPEATVVVRDMTSKYGPNVIHTELECTDYLTYLKIFRSDDVESVSIIEYLESLVYGKYNIKIEDRGKILYWQRRLTKKQQLESYEHEYQERVISDDASGRVSHFVRIPSSDEPLQLGEFNNKDFPEDHPTRKYLETESISIPSANRSIYMVLQDLFKKCPRGPWYISGRGPWLIIHNRNLGGDVERSYKYMDEPGQLIDFKAKTKFENFERQSISYAGMDAKDRKNFFIDDYRRAILEQRTIKEILEDKTIPDAQKKVELKTYLELYEGGYSTFRTTRSTGAFIDPGTREQFFTVGNFDEPILRKKDSDFAVRDKTNSVNPNIPPGIKQAKEASSYDIKDLILRANWYTIPLLSYDQAVNVTNNRERELAMEKEEANIIVEGDPGLQDQQKILISNVHRQHEGTYYIKKCEHQVGASGYKTTLECFKVVPEATIDTIGTITQEKYEAGQLTEQQETVYKREQLVYGSDVLITGDKLVGTRYLVKAGPASSVTPYEKYKGQQLRLSDLYKPGTQWTQDTWIEEAIRIHNLTDPTVTSTSTNPENR